MENHHSAHNHRHADGTVHSHAEGDLLHEHSAEPADLRQWAFSMLEQVKTVRLYCDPQLSVGADTSTNTAYGGAIEYHEHNLGAKQMSQIFGIPIAELPDGLGWQTETIKIGTHQATHCDAPIHYKPKLWDGSAAPGIDSFPPEHFVGHAVILDMRDKPNGSIFDVPDIEELLERMEYRLRARDIVLLLTGGDKYLGKADYLEWGQGITAEVVRWFKAQGVNVIGTDCFTIDEPFPQMVRRYATTKDPSVVWPAHFASDTLLHFEKLTNLAELPPTGSIFLGPPMPLPNASAGPANPIALVPAQAKPIKATRPS
jgi:kynurenine formamidase